MEALRLTWLFTQDQALGTRWLNTVIGNGLSVFGLDTTSRLGGSIQFFLYDVVKITVLLCVLIFVILHIQSYFPPEQSKRILGRFHGIWANIIATLLGTITSFCSCSSISLFTGFTNAGLPLGVTFSFLTSSPMVGLGDLVLLVSAFGAKIAIVYIVTGLVIVIVGGTVIEKMHMENYVEDFIRNADNVGVESDALTVRGRWIFAKEWVTGTFKKVFPYTLIGAGVGVIIHNWIPEGRIQTVSRSNSPFDVVLAVLVGVPMHADISGTISVTEALLAKRAQFSTILSSMTAVTMLNLPPIIMLKKAVRVKLLGLFIIIYTPGTVTVGYLLNVFQHLLI